MPDRHSVWGLDLSHATLSAGLSAFARLLAHPFDTMRTRQIMGMPAFAGSLRGLFKGLIPGLVISAPGGGAYLLTYDFAKNSRVIQDLTTLQQVCLIVKHGCACNVFVFVDCCCCHSERGRCWSLFHPVRDFEAATAGWQRFFRLETLSAGLFCELGVVSALFGLVFLDARAAKGAHKRSG